MINTVTRTGCTDQRREEGPLYRQGSSRRKLLAATMEITGITRGENASAPLGKPLHHHDGINLVFTQRHPRVKKDKSK